MGHAMPTKIELTDDARRELLEILKKLYLPMWYDVTLTFRDGKPTVCLLTDDGAVAPRLVVEDDKFTYDDLPDLLKNIRYEVAASDKLDAVAVDALQTYAKNMQDDHGVDISDGIPQGTIGDDKHEHSNAVLAMLAAWEAKHLGGSDAE